MATARGGPSRTPEFPIRVVAERTGLTPAALRAWERRYAVVAPTRSDGSQRLYSAADIERLTLIARLATEGHGLAALAKRSTNALEKLARHVAPASPKGPRDEQDDDVVDRLMAETRAFDSVALRASLTTAIIDHGTDIALERIVAPFLARVGDAWARGEASVAHEHMASAVVRDVLGWLLQSTTAHDSAPTLVAATIAGESHEFGATMAAVAAARAGWRVVHLGANVPAADLAHTVRTSGARVVVLGIVCDGAGHDIRGEISALRKAVGANTRIVAGGAATATNRLSLRRANVEVLPSRDELLSVLDSVWTRSTAA